MTGQLVRAEIPGRWEGGAPRGFAGPALHGWLFDRLKVRQPALAAALHELDDVRPFTSALLEGVGERIVLTGYGPAAEAVAAVADQLKGSIELRWREGPRILGGRWTAGVDDLGRTAAATPEWATWDELAAPLRGGGLVAGSALEFLSPTTFHPRDYVPLPLPQLVFGNLLKRWQRWSDVDLGEGAAAAIEEGAVVRSYSAHSVDVRMKDGGVQAFVGRAEWRLRRAPPAYAGLLGVLAAFARFSGVGHKVGMGFGCVDRWPRLGTGCRPG